jgi:hypothetical protein
VPVRTTEGIGRRGSVVRRMTHRFTRRPPKRRNTRSPVAVFANDARAVRERGRHPCPNYGGVPEVWHVVHRMTRLSHPMNQNSENFRCMVAQFLNGAHPDDARAVTKLCRHPYPNYGGVPEVWHVIYRMTQIDSSVEPNQRRFSLVWWHFSRAVRASCGCVPFGVCADLPVQNTEGSDAVRAPCGVCYGTHRTGRPPSAGRNQSARPVVSPWAHRGLSTGTPFPVFPSHSSDAQRRRSVDRTHRIS